VTSPGKGGPIILVQNESDWTCGDDSLAEGYLGELNRYFREAGLNVPIINSNNLWVGAEGEVDCWNGAGDLLPIVRQLAAVRPHQPRLVVEFNVAAPTVWGGEAPRPVAPEVLEHRLAQVLAAGGQFNIQPFHGGTNFGFWGGRLPEAPAAFVTTSRDLGAPLSEIGRRGPAFNAVRRISTFASRFSRLLANLDNEYRPVVPCPTTAEEGDAKGRSGRNGSAFPTVVYGHGTQGGVAFIFRGHKGGSGKLRLLLPQGGDMQVDVGEAAVTWCLFDTYLGGRAKLDYCSLSAFASVGRSLVLFGDGGVEGSVSINGSPLRVTVPKGKAPTVLTHEGVTLVVAATEQLEAIYATDDAVYVGVSGLSHAGQPLALHGEKKCTRIGTDGVVAQVPALAPPARTRGDKPSISDWETAATGDYCAGTSARYASINGASDLGTLGAPYGYGWYRVKLKSPGGKVRVAAPHSGDRLQVYADGEFAGIIGSGPGAAPEIGVTLKKGHNTLVVLAENFGRVAGGAALGEPKGLFGDIWEVHPLKTAKPAIKSGDPVDVLAFRSPLWEVQSGDTTLSDRLTWTVTLKKKAPFIVSVGKFEGRAILLVNGKAAAYLDRGGGERHFISAEQAKGGANLVQVALLGDHGLDEGDAERLYASLAAEVSFTECAAALSAKAEWAFARWEPPRPTAFGKAKSAKGDHRPAWWRAKLSKVTGNEPVYFEATGLSKGQLYVNGRHLCRYFVATADGAAVTPQSLYYIPGPWLHADAENEILIFDEHGGNPSRCRVVHGS
jgi:hypothetical protein